MVEEVIVPAKYSAPTQYYEQEETGDFPEDLFEQDEVVKQIETEKKEAVIAQVSLVKIVTLCCQVMGLLMDCPL